MNQTEHPPRWATLALALASISAQAQPASTTLDAISVVGEPYVEYKPERTRSATRTDTPIQEIAQSVSAIPKEALEDVGETGILSALELGGVGRANVFAGGIASYTLRGFSSGAFYRNGMASIGYGAVPDTTGIESLDVVRGPSSSIFGSGDPGGTFSIVSKQPLDDAAYEAGLSWDSHGGRRVTTDLTGPINATGTLAYRVNAALNGGATFQDHVRNHKEYVAPRLSFQISPQTRVLLDVEVSRAKSLFYRGVPIHTNLRYGPPSRSFFHGDPNTGRVHNRNTTSQLRLEHAFSDAWHLDVGLQRTVGRVHGYALELRDLQPDGHTFTRRLTLRENRWDGNLAQAYLRGKFQLAGMEHQVLSGVEYQQSYSRVDNRSTPASILLPIDIYQPVYGTSLPFGSVRSPSTSPGTTSHTRALVIQDQIYLSDALNVLLGLRYDRYQSYSSSTFENDVITPRLGASYAFTDTVSGYASYSRSFKPNNRQDANGKTFDPERGKSLELGLKTELFDRRLQVTTAVFHTIKTNVLTRDPADPDPDARILAGEIRSQGVDISATGKIGDRTRLIAYLGWIDAEITKDNNPNMPPGTRLQDIPMHRASLMVMHALKGTLAGVEIGAALQYVGSRSTASNNTGIKMPAYSTANLMLNYQINPAAKLRLSVKNLFDRRYYERSFGSYGVPGEPRALYATVEYSL